MSAGSGDGTSSVARTQEVARARGSTRTTPPGAATFGSEQHEQEWQFGGHWPPETSVGQLSSQGPSPQSAANPLTSKVSSVKNTMRAARRNCASIPQDDAEREPAGQIEVQAVEGHFFRSASILS